MTSKFIVAGLVIIFITVSFGFAGQTKAATDFFYYLDNFLIRPLLRLAANALENQLLNVQKDIFTDAANGNIDPHFITDWRDNTLITTAQGNLVFQSILADTQLCPYFGDTLKTIFGATQYAGLSQGHSLTYPPGMEFFQFLNQCSLSGNANVNTYINDPNGFIKGGGWQTWVDLLRPENNANVLFDRTIAEQASQISIEKQSSYDERVANKGLKPSRIDALGGTTRSSGCEVKSPLSVKGVPVCIFFGKTVTPGDIFSNINQAFFNQKPNELSDARDLEDVLLIISDAVISKLSQHMFNYLVQNSYSEPNAQGFISQGQAVQAQAHALVACQQACQNQSTAQCDTAPVDQQQQCRNNAFISCNSQCR